MKEQPILLTLFGATGDLAFRKLYPAIYQLYRSGRLSQNFALIGTGQLKTPCINYKPLETNMGDSMRNCFSSFHLIK